MNPKRVFLIMIGLLVLVSGGGVATVILGNKILQHKSAQLLNLKLQDRVLDDQQTALKKANADIAKYADLEKIAQTIVPQDKDQAAAVREIVDIAGKAGLGIDQISFSASNLGSSTSTSSTSSSTSTTSTPLSQAKPVDGLPGVYALEISIVPASASYYQFLNFLTGLENNRRTSQVTSIAITPTISNKQIAGYTFKLTIDIFIKPPAGGSR